MYLIYQFSKLVDLSTTVAGMAGVTHRIAELAEVLETIKVNEFFDVAHPELPCSDKNSSSASSQVDIESGGVALMDPLVTNVSPSVLSLREGVFARLKGAQLVPPNHPEKILFANLNLELTLHEDLLIMGKSSAGKSSFMRVLRGLWPLQSGKVHKDSNVTSFYIPQKPFFTNGSLRDQVVYPEEVNLCEVSNQNDSWLINSLEELELSDLVDRCGGSLDSDPKWSWYDVLSPGEMQRLAFLRLFYHKPQVAFLDEATSALSTDIEDLLYRRCKELNMTLVSVGHRENLKQFHKKLLTLSANESAGDWALELL